MTNSLVLCPIINYSVSKHLISYKLNEMCNLVKAIDIKVVHAESFRLIKPSSSTLLREGKLNYIRDLVNKFSEITTKIDLLVFSVELSPIQQRNLEKTLNLKILDKTSLILEIFGARAASKEGLIQVELAHLNWQRSRLVRSWTHLERQRGGFGFLGGPGEAQIELDKRLIDTRIKRLKSNLKSIKKTRNIQYLNRKHSKVPMISLLGYTNAGKSTLFNKLAKQNMKADDKLFVTLDTKISSFYLPNIKNAYISDTVGFVSDLPTHLINAFKSTLEEINNADILLHVRDSSDEESENHKLDVISVLDDLNIYPNTNNGPPMIEVMNKIDLNKTLEIDKLTDIKTVYISAKTGKGINKLINNIENLLFNK